MNMAKETLPKSLPMMGNSLTEPFDSPDCLTACGPMEPQSSEIMAAACGLNASGSFAEQLDNRRGSAVLARVSTR